MRDDSLPTEALKRSTEEILNISLNFGGRRLPSGSGKVGVLLYNTRTMTSCCDAFVYDLGENPGIRMLRRDAQTHEFQTPPGNFLDQGMELG